MANGGVVLVIKNKSYSFYSALFSIIGLLSLIMTYVIAPDHPQGFIVFVMVITLSLAVILLIAGIITSILAIKNRELGVRKYFGILVPIFIGLFYILMPLIIGIGLIIHDQP